LVGDAIVTMNGVDFGVFLVPESNTYETLRNRAFIADELGYHSLWVSDHLVGMYDSPVSPRLECWTTVAALGAATSNVMLGQLTMAAPFRNPALLAKMAATLDVITDGRAILSVGAGWHEGEFNAYGYDYGTKRSRAGRLEEAAKIIKLMWTEEAPSFEGRYYSINEARCSPKPVQKPHMPLMVAGDGERLTLRTAARHGDMSNFAHWVGTPETFRHKAEVLERHCLSVGRDPDEIRKTWAAFVFIDEDRGRAEEKSEPLFSGLDWTPPTRGLVGDPETVTQRINQYVDEGATLFILSFLGGDWERDARLFMEKVASEFR